MTASLLLSVRQFLGGLQVAGALALLITIVALLVGTLPSLAGYESYVVFSGSMEPAIGVGDLVVVQPVKAEQLAVGDVLTYRTPQRPDIVITHRLVGIEPDPNGGLKFQTKGDANDSADQVQVDQRAGLGRVAYAVPKVGYLVEFSKRPEGKLLLIGVPGLLLVLDYLLVTRRRTRNAQPLRGEASELVARGRVALQNGGVQAALALFDRAIAANPHLEEAWLLKAQCLEEPQEQQACLRAGLTVNPGSSKLREALDRGGSVVAAVG